MITSVAIPVLNGAETLERTLSAVVAQRLPGELEVVVVDSGSVDDSIAIARRLGAEVVQIAPGEFGHGRTRNLLMRRSRGDHVAFLTQDSVPADEHWLSRLLDGFSLADDVGLTFGPYRPWPGASPMVARELTQWFTAFSPQGTPSIDRLTCEERGISSRALMGRRGYFTDANGCVSRTAWEQVPFRDVPYAEDHVLAHDMLRAGFAKAFVPLAATLHSHEYRLAARARRSFDEARALYDVYSWYPSASPRVVARNLWGNVGADRRWALASAAVEPPQPVRRLRLLTESTLYHLAESTGSLLGGRAQRLPAQVRARLSLEGRPG